MTLAERLEKIERAATEAGAAAYAALRVKAIAGENATKAERSDAFQLEAIAGSLKSARCHLSALEADTLTTLETAAAVE